MPRSKSETYFKASLCREYVGRFESKGYPQERTIINGIEATDEVINDVRTWGKEGNKSTSMWRLDRVLVALGLSLTDFELWARERDPDYIIQKGEPNA